MYFVIGSLGIFRLGKVGLEAFFGGRGHDPHRGLGPKAKMGIYLAMQFFNGLIRAKAKVSQ